jgi:hypothetical protein
MTRKQSFSLAAALGILLLMAGWLVSGALGQSADPQAAPKLSAEQQKQLEQLKQMEQKLQQDREAVHAAITEFGWDSDEVDEAQAKLFRDREEYRKLRRALRSSGVPVPPAGVRGRTGFGAGPEGWGGPGSGGGGGYGRGRHHGCGHHCGGCGCPGCAW